jgi:DNA polymerase III alpha subunit
VIEYLKGKYGLGFAQVATYQKMKTKNAIKDAMWALHGRNRNDPEVKAICNTIPDSPQGVDEADFLYGYTDQEDIYHRGQIEENETLGRFFKVYPEVERMVKRLIGVVRGFSRHPSAYVVSTLDLSGSNIPTMLIKDKKLGIDVTVTQYEAGMVEKSGLVKADILRVTTLDTVSQCLDLVKARTGKDFHAKDGWGVEEIYRLPEDEAIYTDIFNKKTDSSFQFNTPLIKSYVQDFVPLRREDLSDFTALCRPGALDAPLLFNATVVVEYEDGSKETYPSEEYKKWQQELQKQKEKK